MTQENEAASGLAISNALDIFVQHIDSLAEALPLTMVAINLAQMVAHRTYRKFVDEFCQSRTEEDKEYIQVETTHVYKFEKLEKRLDRILLAERTVPRSFVVSLVSHYDFFLGWLIKSLYLMKPEMLRASDRTMSLPELLEFNSIDEAQQYILEKEVEAVLRKSHSEQFDWLEHKFSISLRKDLSVWPTFIEVTERRNLFVHAGGVVSNQYLKICKQHGYDLDRAIVIGTELGVTKAYFDTAYQAIYEIGVKLAHVLWRKIKPNEIEEADKNLSNRCYDLLKEGKNELSKILLDFATDTLKKHSDEESRLVFVVNRAQAYKWIGNEEAALKIISAEDWSATGDKFKLAKAVLTNDFLEACTIMKRIGASGFPSKSDYRDWPLFKEFRKSEEFLKTFEEVFGEPYSKFETEASDVLNEEEYRDIFEPQDDVPSA
jgi:hypothetical protein